MDPATNNNPGATARSEPPEDLSQTRYFPPVGEAQAQPGAQPPSQGHTSAQAQGPYAYPPPAQSTPYGYTPPPAQSAPYGYAPPPTNGQAPAQTAPAPVYGPGARLPLGSYSDRSRAIWGLVLVAGGILLLANTLFSFDGFGSLILLLLGGIFMYAYFSTRPGYRIGYLIPGSILLGLGVGTALEDLNFLNIWGGDIVPLTLGLGFCFIWFMERKHWWALIPGGILVLVGFSSMYMIGRLWPLILVGIGVYMLYEQARRRPAS